MAESIAFGHFVTKLTTIVSISDSFIWLLIVVLLPARNLNVNLVIWLYASLFLLRRIVYIGLNYSKYVKVINEKSIINLRNVLLMNMPYLWMRLVGTFDKQIPISLLKNTVI